MLIFRAHSIAIQPNEPFLESILQLNTALQFVCILTLAGTAFFHTVILNPTGSDRKILGRRYWPFVLFCLITSVLALPLGALYLIDGSLAQVWQPRLWLPYVLPAQFTSSLVQVVALVCAILFSLFSNSSVRWWILSCYTVAVITPAFTGHSRTAQPSWLFIGIDMVHLLSGALWLGGVVAFLRLVTSRNKSPRLDMSISEIVQRFSTFALSSVALLIASGVAMAVSYLAEVGNPLSARYMQTLLLKIVLVTFVGAFAWWNRKYLAPQLPGKTIETQLQYLRFTLTIEVSLIALVALLSGFLVHMNPGH